jgi:hypothetical protein
MASFSEPDKKVIESRDRGRSTFTQHGLSNAPALVQKPSSKMTQNMVTLNPFSRVPADVLSLVFIEAALMNWRAPLQLGAVCTRWRDTLLCTPRAWACLTITPSSQITNSQLLDLWFSRCGALKLHISLDILASRAAVDVICRHERNIQCLSLFKNSKVLRGHFTQLEELRLGHDALRAKGHLVSYKGSIPDANELQERGVLAKECCILDVKRFPKLVTLHLHSPSVATMAAIACRSSFPPLQELHIEIGSHYWSQIIEYCAETLLTLAIELPYNFSLATSVGEENQSPITLPRLQKLFYVNRSTGTFVHGPTLPLINTPALHTYHETNGHQISPFHKDVSSVTSIFLQLVTAVDWSQFPLLTHLQLLAHPVDIKNALGQLENNPHLCTKLTSVDCAPLYPPTGWEKWESTLRLSMQKRSNATGRSVALNTNANGRAAYSTVR